MRSSPTVPRSTCDRFGRRTRRRCERSSRTRHRRASTSDSSVFRGGGKAPPRCADSPSRRNRSKVTRDRCDWALVATSRARQSTAVELTVDSLGGERHRIAVRGHELVVDQPREDGGEDIGPTPTELFVASLAACVAHYARRGLGRGAGGPKVQCNWTMSQVPPWRVAAIDIAVSLPPETSQARLYAVRRAVAHCTVHNSLEATPTISISAAVAPSTPASERMAAVA